MATPERRFYANAAPQQQLQNPVSSGDTTLTIVGSFVGWPTSFPYYAALDFGLATSEIVKVTGVAGKVATIQRAQDGTSAASHSGGSTFDQVVIRQDFDEANAHASALTAVHGVSGAIVGTGDVQTLTNKTLVAPTITGAIGGSALDRYPRGFLADARDGVTVVTMAQDLNTTTYQYTTARATITLAQQRRIRIYVKVVINPAASSSGHYFVRAWYRPAGGVFATTGQTSSRIVATVSTSDLSLDWQDTLLLPAGTYEFQPAIARSGGNAADQVTSGLTILEDIGNI